MYYYHARYYDPRISMFYGVDPHAENYMSFSSYAYVGNNPLIRIDPDGRDIWEIDNAGYVVRKEENTKHILFHVNEKGERGKSIELSSESILLQLSTDRPETRKSSDYKFANFFKSGIRYAESDNKEDVFSVFYFGANNTKVEWALDGYKENGKSTYIIATGHNPGYAPHTFTDHMPERDLRTQFFSIHSHQAHNSRGGGPWSEDKSTWRWKETNLNGRGSPAPHYVYEVKEKNLYWYGGYQGQKGITRPNINRPSDLYRNLGF